MNYLKEIYKDLAAKNYFDTNVNIIVKSASKPHRRSFEEFICLDGNFKSFCKRYTVFKEKIQKDKSFGIACIYLFRDVCYDNEIDPTLYKSLAILIASAFIENAVFKVGNLQIKNRFTLATQTLFDVRESVGATNKKCNILLDLELKDGNTTSLEIAIESVLENYWMQLLEPVLLEDNPLLDSIMLYRIKIEKQITRSSGTIAHEVALRSTNITKTVKSEAALRNILNKLVIESTADFLKNIGCISDVANSRSDNTFLSNIRGGLVLNRAGFLKFEDQFGCIYLEEPISKYKTLKYIIQEVVTSKGVKVTFKIFIGNTLVQVLEDYTDNRFMLQVDYLALPDDKDPLDELGVELLAVECYRVVWAHYCSIVNDRVRVEVDSVIKDFDVDESYEEVSNENEYDRKLVYIAPYRRKLPKGAKRDQDRYDLALKFNIVLESDETVVTGFKSKRRILKSTPTGEDIVGIKHSEI